MLPAEISRLRVRDPAQMDLWDASSCGLIKGEEFAGLLESLRIGPADVAEIQGDLSAGSVSYIARDPDYVPFESNRIPRNGEADRMGLEVLRVALSAVAAESIMASPLAATALVAAASIRRLPASPAGKALEMLTAILPPKGAEIARLVPIYCARHAVGPEHAASMVIRDFYAYWYTLAFIRTRDGREGDLCGSALCTTTAVDYVDTADGSGSGSDVHLAAASEGLACLGGKAATQALRDAAVAGALIRARDSIRVAAGRMTDVDGYIAAAGGPAAPGELFRVRWWDGALPPSFRMIMGMAPYRHLVDERGAFRSADRCPAIKRAIDSTIRYNEIVDLVSDYRVQECLNELLAALEQGGGRSVSGYGNACARVIDDALECACGEQGHEEAAESAMGGLLFYLHPRWGMARQVTCFSAAAQPVRNAFAWRKPGERLRAVARTVLRPGDALHSAAWQPLWADTDASPSDPTTPWAAELARRAARRCLPRGAGPGAVHRCEAVAGAVIAACDRLDDQDALRELAEPWCLLYDAAVDAAVLDAEARHIASGLRPLIARLWRQTVIGYDDRSIEETDEADVLLYLDLYSSLRRGYALTSAEDRYAVRRAFLGTATSAIELSGLGPYNRLTDLAARLCASG